MKPSPFFLPLAAVATASAVVLTVASPVPADDAAGEKARIAAVTRPTTDFTSAEDFELRSGGAATMFGPFNHDAFSAPSANMSFERRADFSVGNGVFRKLWVSAPSSTTSSDGLGPLFNARGCQSCHLKDGRGHPPDSGRDDPAASMVMAIHLPNGAPEPRYGRQIQTLGIQGIRAEALVRLSYQDRPVRFADGMVVNLRNPHWSLSALGNGAIDPGTVLSPRVAPPMIGVGLLETIRDDDIRANADPADRDGDGISGRVSMVTDPETGRDAIGRMGWKAGQATVRAQAATAFFNDMGLSTPLFTAPYGDCTEAQADCRHAPHGGDGGTTVEVDPRLFDLVVFYSRNLAVPARRDVSDPLVLAGKKLFYESGCTACHRPKYVTRRLGDRPEQSFQLIWPSPISCKSMSV